MGNLKPRICAKKDCGAKATHFAGVRLRSSKNDPGMPCLMDFPLCQLHAHSLKVVDVISNEGWDQLASGNAAVAGKVPRRELTQVMVQPIDEAPIVFRERYE